MSKREDMLKSALVLFANEGYENVGIQKIVDSVQVKKPTLYHYFGSKQGLLITLLDDYYTIFFNNLVTTANYNGDIVLTLESIVKLYYQVAINSPEYYRFLLSLKYSSSLSEASNTVLPYMDKEFNILEQLFKSAESDHGNMKGRSNNFAITFQGMINSYITSYLNGKNSLKDEDVHQACRQFMYGIFS
ncbi:MAG: TetR/AcrR family transcriptional regulator [Spirochaetaceae bacterium]